MSKKYSFRSWTSSRGVWYWELLRGETIVDSAYRCTEADVDAAYTNYRHTLPCR